jgi:hypothetical protein
MDFLNNLKPIDYHLDVLIRLHSTLRKHVNELNFVFVIVKFRHFTKLLDQLQELFGKFFSTLANGIELSSWGDSAHGRVLAMVFGLSWSRVFLSKLFHLLPEIVHDFKQVNKFVIL